MNWDTCEEPFFFKSFYTFVRRVGMRSLDFFRPRGALVRSHTFFKSLYVWGSRDKKTGLFMVRGLFIKLKKVS